MALVLAVKMGLFLKDFSKCLRQSIAQFPFVLETDFSFRGGLNRNRYKDGQNFSQIGPMVTEIWCCNLGLSHITGKCLTFFNPLFKSILVQKVWQSDKIWTFFWAGIIFRKIPMHHENFVTFNVINKYSFWGLKVKQEIEKKQGRSVHINTQSLGQWYGTAWAAQNSQN